MIKVLSKAPKEYLQQGLSQCGAYSVKGILSAYGKDDGRPPRNYQPNLLAKYTSITGPATWSRLLQSYGFNAKLDNTRHLSDDQRINLFKSLIDNDVPVMVRIGNGYLRNGSYSKFVASFMGHWITIWGYNDDEKVFYVYDSYVPKERYDRSVPIGNTKRTFEQMNRDTGKGYPRQRKFDYIKLT